MNRSPDIQCAEPGQLAVGADRFLLGLALATWVVAGFGVESAIAAERTGGPKLSGSSSFQPTADGPVPRRKSTNVRSRHNLPELIEGSAPLSLELGDRMLIGVAHQNSFLRLNRPNSEGHAQTSTRTQNRAPRKPNYRDDWVASGRLYGRFDLTRSGWLDLAVGMGGGINDRTLVYTTADAGLIVSGQQAASKSRYLTPYLALFGAISAPLQKVARDGSPPPTSARTEPNELGISRIREGITAGFGLEFGPNASMTGGGQFALGDRGDLAASTRSTARLFRGTRIQFELNF